MYRNNFHRLLRFLLWICIHIYATPYKHGVKIFYFVGDASWITSGTYPVSCGDIKCDVITAHTKEDVQLKFNSTCAYSYGYPVLTVGVYMVAYIPEGPHPVPCDLPVHFEMYESLESKARFQEMFDEADKHFIYNTTTSIYSTIPRYYEQAILQDLLPTLPFSKLIKGTNYIASDCEVAGSRVPSHREKYILEMRALGYRVDGLGICLHTADIPENITLKGPNSGPNDPGLSKPEAVSRYLFHLAFENTIEEGYVSEKPFDALLAGTVPIYLGDAVHMKKLAPHPKALIYVADFDYNMTRLVSYLTYLAGNETAYEEHRAWRKTFSTKALIDSHPMLQTPWQCQVCQWAVQKVNETVIPTTTQEKKLPLEETRIVEGSSDEWSKKLHRFLSHHRKHMKERCHLHHPLQQPQQQHGHTESPSKHTNHEEHRAHHAVLSNCNEMDK